MSRSQKEFLKSCSCLKEEGLIPVPRSLALTEEETEEEFLELAEAPQGMVTISDVVEPNSNGSSDFDPAKGALSAEFTIQVNDNSMENLVVSIGETVLDMAGNNLVPASDNLQTVDTVNPDVTGASNDVAEGVASIRCRP